MAKYFFLGLLFGGMVAPSMFAQCPPSDSGLPCISVQRPTESAGGNNGGSSSENHGSGEEPQLSQKDQAWNLTREGSIARLRYEQSNLSADYQAALDALVAALKKYPNYGPAWLQLCELYLDATHYTDALSACKASMHNGGGGKEFKHETPKDIERKWISYIQLMRGKQAHADAVAKWKVECGTANGGEVSRSADQFSAGFTAGITATPLDRNQPVDPSVDIMRSIAACQQRAAALAVEAKGIASEEAAYVASTKGKE